MLSLILITFLILPHYNTSYATNSDGKKIFCMYMNGERNGIGRFRVELINEYYCTHMIYAYLGIDDEGKIKSLKPNFDLSENYGRSNIKKFNNKKHHNKSLKTLVAVGGFDGTESSNRYSALFSIVENQQRFVNSTIEFLIKNNFDGLALHWVYPGERGGNPDIDKYSFISLLKTLKREFSKKNSILVVICHGYTYVMDDSYIVEDIMENVDYVYLFSYDFYGYWSKHIGVASALYTYKDDIDSSVHKIVNNWIERGAKPEKLLMGIPFFSRTFTLTYNNETDVGSPFIGAGNKTEYVQYEGLMSYMELCQRLLERSWAVKWNNIQKNPYAFDNDQWAGFEDHRSLELKAKYVIENKMAGVVVASLEDDDFLGICGDGKYPLLRTLNSYLKVGPESDFEYILNTYLFKRTKNSGYSQCVYHRSEILNSLN